MWTCMDRRLQKASLSRIEQLHERSGNLAPSRQTFGQDMKNEEICSKVRDVT